MCPGWKQASGAGSMLIGKLPNVSIIRSMCNSSLARMSPMKFNETISGVLLFGVPKDGAGFGHLFSGFRGVSFARPTSKVIGARNVVAIQNAIDAGSSGIEGLLDLVDGGTILIGVDDGKFAFRGHATFGGTLGNTFGCVFLIPV